MSWSWLGASHHDQIVIGIVRAVRLGYPNSPSGGAPNQPDPAVVQAS